MSEHDIADCPKCGKRDYVLREDNHWICLKCGYTQKMSTSHSESDSNPGILSTLVAALIAILFVIVALSA